MKEIAGSNDANVQSNSFPFHIENSEPLSENGDMTAIHPNVSPAHTEFVNDMEVFNEIDDTFHFNSDSESDSGSSVQEDTTAVAPERPKSTFCEYIAHWSLQYNVKQNAVSALLAGLKDFVDVPKDARTLLKTPNEVAISDIGGGQYVHFGLERGIVQVLKHVNNLIDGKELLLQFNVDGLPIFKSRNSSLWPICGKLCNNGLPGKVFIIGAFYGDSKPHSVDEYLRNFIEEYNRLQERGFQVNGHTVNVKLHSCICDAPARAFVKCVRTYSGYNSCEKCKIKGEYLHDSVRFISIDAERRLDADFTNPSREDTHHVRTSPLVNTEMGKDV